jgi:tetratricopeptide (TPR) repeat protein
MTRTLATQLILATLVLVVVAAGLRRGSWNRKDDDLALAGGGSLGLSATSRDALSRTIEQMEARRQRNPQDRAATLLLCDALMRQSRATGQPALVYRALFYLEPAVASNPEDYELRRMLATLYGSVHRFGDALREANRCREQRPSDPWNYGVIGDAHVELGEYQQAFTAIQQMVELKPSAAAYSRVSYALELQGRLEWAVQAMQLAVDATPAPDTESSAWFHAHLGDLLLQLNRLPEARLAFAWAERVFPRHPLVRAAIARLKEAEGDDDGALAMNREVFDRTGLPDIAAAIGDILARHQNLKEAERWYGVAEDAWRRGGQSERDHLAAFLAEHDRHLDEAVMLATERLSASRTIWSYDAFAWACYKSGRLSDAGRAAAEALRTGTRNAGILYHAASISLAAGDRAGAQRLLNLLPASAAQPRRIASAIETLQAEVELEHPPHRLPSRALKSSNQLKTRLMCVSGAAGVAVAGEY